MIAGIDLGGTQVRIAFASPDGQIKTIVKTKMDLLRTSQRVVDWLADQVNHRGLKSQLEAVGIGTPGPIDIPRGVIVNTPNLKGWQNTPIVKMLTEALDCPVHFGNDANLAGWGEFHQGAGKGVNHMIYITWSTGVGGGLILDGKLVIGAHSSAGEVGHMILDPDPNGPICGCGQRGCLEALASGANLAKQYGESAVELFRSAREGDQEAQKVVQRIAGYMGQGLVNLTNVFDPELIVIGGGFTHSWSQVQPLLLAALRSSPCIKPSRRPKLRRAQLGDRGGLIGAIEWARACL